MIIFASVDGTGVWDDADYDITFENSHVHTLYKEWHEGPRYYERGPVTGDNKLSRWTVLAANRTYNAVMKDWQAGEKAVFLAGYSRGGAAVIEVAKWLKAVNVPVECLILFDPVDRTGQVGLPWINTPIVDTVKTVIYAQRSSYAHSRESFGNCGMTSEDLTKTKRYFDTFFATHGGIGGVPWPGPTPGMFINEGFPDFETRVTVADDELGSQKVQNWVFNLVFDALYNCKQRLTQAGLPQAIKNPVAGHPPIIHIVQPGDWLSKIAITYYKDMNKWPIIYEANRPVIGNNPDLIVPGMRLVIP